MGATITMVFLAVAFMVAIAYGAYQVKRWVVAITVGCFAVKKHWKIADFF